MTLSRRGLLGGACTSLALAASRRNAGAVIILDSTYKTEGFRAHIALANQPQFAPLIAFSEDGGEEWDACSGTWIGNFGGLGYLLTAAHNYKRGEAANHYLYRTNSGQICRGTGLFVHPYYNGDGNNRSGYDFGIVRLDGPVMDSGPQPALYASRVREGTRIVMVGFGARGIGSQGEESEFDTPRSNKTAAENTVDEIMDPDLPPPPDDDAGNWLRVTLRKPSEGGQRLDGILGGGDSGGSVWTRVGGQWVIVAVNATGTGDTYGEHSYFGCVSGVRSWLTGLLPGLRFV